MRPPLLFLLFAACGEPEPAPETPVTLVFDAQIDGESARCGDSLPLGEQQVAIADLRWYLSDIALLTADGGEHSIVLDGSSAFQSPTLALLDFEDGSGACASAGTPQLHTEITGLARDLEYTGIAFTLGVPFDGNHGDSATAEAPLNVSTMFWSWQSGYKFLRLDSIVDGSPWNFHLGSTRCASDGATRPPAIECDTPNRPRIVLNNFSPAEDQVVLQLDALLAGLSGGVFDYCMSGPDQREPCVVPFNALGMAFETGRCVDDCEGQTAFTIQPQP